MLGGVVAYPTQERTMFEFRDLGAPLEPFHSSLEATADTEAEAKEAKRAPPPLH